jgi:Phosphoenolpyruvate carboxylase
VYGSRQATNLGSHRLAAAALPHYRALVYGRGDLFKLFLETTPVRERADVRLGSRPAYRTPSEETIEARCHRSRASSAPSTPTTALMWPEAQQRFQALFNRGLGQPGEMENRFGELRATLVTG